MSEEEWRTFHANPTVEGMTRELVQGRFATLNCGCNTVVDILLDHLTAENALFFAARLRKLHFRANMQFMMCIFTHFDFKYCTKFLDAFDFVPGSDLIWEALTWFHTDYEGDEEDEMWYPYDHFFEGDAKQIIISLVDRCRLVYPKSPDMLLPEFVCDFLDDRQAAAICAIHTMHAMKKMVGKDVARMIARVIWEGRKYYPSDLKNECKRVARFSRESHG